MKELEAFREQIDKEETEKEAKEADKKEKPMRAAERQKLRRAAERQRTMIACRSGCACPQQSQADAWVVSTRAAQAAIAGAMPARTGSSGPEGPGFIRLPEV